MKPMKPRVKLAIAGGVLAAALVIVFVVLNITVFSWG